MSLKDKPLNINQMKTLIIAIVILLPFLSNGQAHLGSTFSDIKGRYPGKEFSIKLADDGTKIASADMTFGTFYYVFNQETGLTVMCLQVPDDMKALNTQVEIYNKKYVIVSDRSWKAYLEGGGIMKIDLEYDEDLKSYLFLYTDLSEPTKFRTSEL
jgi:hypothetical protein